MDAGQGGAEPERESTTTLINESGAQLFRDVNTYPPSEPLNVYRQASVDVIFAQVWTRPGLSRRQRRWISLTAAGATGTPVGTTAHVYGALNSGDISRAELGEFLLQFAVHFGWPRATMLDAILSESVTRIAAERGPEVLGQGFDPLDDRPCEAAAEAGHSVATAVLGPAAGLDHDLTPTAQVLEQGLQFGLVWSRPYLPRPDRRLVAITALAVQAEDGQLNAHLDAALASGELDLPALREVALHAGFYAGLPVARRIDLAVSEVLSGRRPGRHTQDGVEARVGAEPAAEPGTETGMETA